MYHYVSAKTFDSDTCNMHSVTSKLRAQMAESMEDIADAVHILSIVSNGPQYNHNRPAVAFQDIVNMLFQFTDATSSYGQPLKSMTDEWTVSDRMMPEPATCDFAELSKILSKLQQTSTSFGRRRKVLSFRILAQ